MNTKLTILGVACGLGLAIAPMAAHHAFTAEFDGNAPITLRGTVTKVEWVNPHSWLYLDVKETDGAVVNWALELGPPNALFRRGWTKDSIPTGVEIMITGFRARSGKTIGNGRTVTFPDGRELFAGSSGTGAPSDNADPLERK